MKLTDYSYGYNLRDGGHNGAFTLEARERMSRTRTGRRGNAGFKMPEEAKQKISHSLKDYYANNVSASKGRIVSEEQRQKLRGHVPTEDTRRKMRENHADVSGAKNPCAIPIRQLATDGSVLREYAYAKLAANELGIDLSSIIKCCRGKAKTCGGYCWEYVKRKEVG